MPISIIAYNRRDSILLACTAGCYAILAETVLGHFGASGGVSLLWPPSGLALAVLLLAGDKFWPAVFAGALIAALLAGNPLGLSVCVAAGNALEAVAGYRLLMRFRQFDADLTRPRHYLQLAAAGVICAPLSAAVGVAGLWWSDAVRAADVPQQLLRWWQGDVLGMILIAPLILVWRKPPAGWLSRARLAETALCFGLAFLFGQMIFLGWLKDHLGLMPGFWMFLFFVWGAVRFGRHGALLVMAVAMVQGLQGVVYRRGFFGAADPQTDLLNFWFYIMVLSAVGMSLALFVHQRNQAEASLRASREKFAALFDLAPLGLARSTLDGRFIEVNDALAAIVGYSVEELVKLSDWDLTPAEYAIQETDWLEALERIGHYGPYEKEYIHRYGHRVAVLLNRVVVTGSDGGKYLWSTIEDITARKKTEESLQLADLVYRSSGEAIMVSDADGNIIDVNPAFTEMTGYSAEEVQGKNARILQSGYQEVEFYEEMWREINAGGCWKGEIWDRRKSGEIYAEWLSINTVFNEDGSAYRRVAQFTDITQRKQSEELLWRQTNFDSVTGLPNRHMFRNYLQRAISEAQVGNRTLALFVLDIDHFKQINETLGHHIGDNMLREVAKRLLHCVRETETVARLGGDEFSIIMTGQELAFKVEILAQRILQIMDEPFLLDGEQLYASISIGITLYPGDAADTDELLKNADQAMYAAKNLGRNRHQYFTPSMQENAQARMKLSNDLRTALSEGQLRVHYQPIVELATGRVRKAEALLRWQHPQRGMVSPNEFIPIAEETGQIIAIGDWVFRESARQVQCWREKFDPQFQVSVNKSPVQFRNTRGEFPSWPEQLQSAGIPGQSIVAEITEGMLMEANDFIDRKLQGFAAAGLEVALDDFGTGYSSLAYIKKFAIDYIKIDQSFVRNMTPHSSDLVLCEAIIVMAHKLGIKVIAEGVETELQRGLLAAAGCDFAQGYLFSRPVPAEEFERLPGLARQAADQSV